MRRIMRFIAASPILSKMFHAIEFWIRQHFTVVRIVEIAPCMM
jgi:hypothetical protein